MRFSFKLTGDMPLIMHQDDVEASDSLERWRKAPEHKNISKAGDDRSPAWTWMTYIYSDGVHVTVPSANLMVAIRMAGAKMPLKGNKTFKEVSQSGLFIATEYLDFTAGGEQLKIQDIEALRDLPFEDQANAVRKMGFRLFVKRARIGQSKHIRVRPRFDVWGLSGSVEVLADEITEANLRMMFDLAGRVGLGDWRPGCKTPGPYGMFSCQLKRN